MAVPLQLSLKVGYGVVFAVAALACLGSVARAMSVEDRATRQGLTALLLTSGLWALTYIGVFVTPTRALKEVWYTAGLIVGFATVFAWLYFCSAYTNRRYHEQQRYQYTGVGLYLLVVGIKLTNPLHGQYFTATMVETPFRHFAITHGPAHWAATGLSYVLAAIGVFMLYEAFVEAGYPTRSLVGLTGLTALPVTLDLLAFESTAIIDVIYAPLGVAAFAVGVLYVAQDRFLAVQLTGNIPEPVIFLDADGRIRECNDAAEALFPSLAGSRGESVTAVTPVESATAEQEIVAVEGEQTQYYLVNGSPLETTQASIDRMLVFVDVTRLEQQRRELERHNEQLEDFSAGIRHELLNSLQVVGGRVTAAGDALDDGDVSEARRRLGRVSERTEDMVTVVDGLSTLARYGQTVDELEAIALEDVIYDARDTVNPAQLSVDVTGAATVEGDWTRLQELLESLFGFLAQNDGTVVRVVPQDNGFAIETDWVPPETLDDDQLFEYTGGLTDTETGLALPKIRTLARVQGWTVSLEQQASGSRIVVGGATISRAPEVPS